MPKSMTGYGNFVSQEEGLAIRAECRSVNHRYLDLSIRLPSWLSAYETLVRTIAQEALGRGRVEIRLTDESGSLAGRQVLLDEDLAISYAEQLKKLEAISGVKSPDPLAILASQNGVFSLSDKPQDQDLLEAQISQAVRGAIGQLNEARAEEGERLARDLLDKAGDLEGLVKELVDRAPQVPLLYRERLLARAEELFEDERPEWYSDQRLFAETALFADRASIDEEVTRLQVHLDSLKNLLKTEAPVGRQLDFLIQEIFREVNTVGSKANDLELTQVVVAAKTLLEKIREQVQNLE